METDMDAYKDDFLQEVNEYLEIFNQAFVDLENGDNDALDEIFRVAHTIKGMAGFLGYASLEKLCHRMEEVLSGIKCGDITIDSDLIDIMLSTVDRINEMVGKIESEGNDEIEIDNLLNAFEIYKYQERGEAEDCIPEESISEIIETPETEETGICSPENGGHNLILNVTIAPDSDIMELKAILVIESLKEAGHVIRTEPVEEDIDSTFKGSLKAFIRGDAEEVEEVMNKISEIDNFEILSCDQGEALEEIQPLNQEEMEDDAPIKDIPNDEGSKEGNEIIDSSVQNNNSLMGVFREKLRKLINVLSRNNNSSAIAAEESNHKEETPEIMVEEDNQEEETLEIMVEEDNQKEETPEIMVEEETPGIMVEENNQQEIADIRKIESNQENCIVAQDNTKKASVGNKRQDTIRVRVSNIDSIMNLVGELVINKGCLLQISQEHRIPELEDATAILDKSITSLQDEVMMMRMVKIEKVFKKFPRMVRDLSRKFEKEIDFEIVGQETELDRTILDEISDPLVHLVRNCVDHGIETPEERAKAGKSQTGHTKLSAKREKSNVIIEIEDDGNGLDLEKIKNKALENGIISPNDLDKLGEDEIRMLIFTPGLSTKDSATEISGRGIGMDAVKTTVEKLGGKIKIYSQKGKGTKMRITLPPTVAIIKSLVIESGDETYAIPISNVVEALDVNKDNLKLIRDQPLLYVREKLLPAIRLKEFFDIGEYGKQLEKEVGIIVERESEEVALLVDSIIDQQEIVIKPLGSVLSKVKGFIGVTILGDGRVIPILDVSALVGGDIDA